MRAVVQRVQRGKVTLQETGQVISEIGQGYVVLLGVGLEDNEADSSYPVSYTHLKGRKF